jgi:hypothetical protein
LLDIRQQSVDIFSFAHIGTETDNFRVGAIGNFCGGLFGAGPVAGADRNPALLGSQLLRTSPSQSPAGGRDQGDFSIYSKIHIVPPVFSY